MKKLLILLFLFISIALFAQQQKGFSVSSSQKELSGKTYALIVGISKYQHPNIPPLQFADRDAVAFRHYLMANGVDSNNIALLLNHNATSSEILRNLHEFCTVKTNAHDKFYFYFSGHGDVESQLITNDGYLLSYDSPDRVYAISAIKVETLQSYTATLSGKGVQAIIVTDACHAGKLAGGIEGQQSVANALKEAWIGEVNILSCQAGETSLEDVRWGGGRGLFSYELINGLSGNADRNHDLKITLFELSLYLNEKVHDGASPLPQNPVIMGDMEQIVANANPLYLEKISGFKSQNFVFDIARMMTDVRHLKLVYSDTISLSVANLRHFEKLVVERKMKNAITVLKDILDNNQPDDDSIIIVLKNDMDSVRSIVNDDWLKSYGYYSIALYFQALYYNYFDDDSLMTFALNKVDSALAEDDKAAYLYWLKGNILDNRSNSLPSTKEQLQAIMLSPNWAIPYYEVAENYEELGQYDSALYYLSKGFAIDSQFVYWYHKGMLFIYAGLNELDSAIYYGLQYVNLHPQSEIMIYNLACCYSLKKDKTNALKYFELALQEGYDYYQVIKEDPDLDFIRGNAPFKALIKKYFPDQHKE